MLPKHLTSRAGEKGRKNSIALLLPRTPLKPPQAKHTHTPTPAPDLKRKKEGRGGVRRKKNKRELNYASATDH